MLPCPIMNTQETSRSAIGQLALKFEGVANKGIGTRLRLLTVRKLEEIREAVNKRRQRL